MKIHEFQAKDILRRYGVAVPRGEVAGSVDQAVQIARDLACEVTVLKAQIHAGGRGKGGGVKLAKNLNEVEENAGRMLGMRLITRQTGAEGRLVKRILVEEGLPIARELYLGIVLDRSVSQLVVMASTEGGVEIEKVAAETPEKILKEWIDPLIGFSPFQAKKLAFGLGLQGQQVQKAVEFMIRLYRAFIDSDASLAEINPLIVTTGGEVIALDAKINFDDNALFRHPGYKELRDLDEEDPLEVEASNYNLNYIKLNGNVGCMVNGAGLAMSTMDIIKLAGGVPANFLDVGGSASPETVMHGFQIILADPKVEAILINIFGGIVRCDRVAQGVIDAARKIKLKKPVIIRLAGTNAPEAAELLHQAKMDFIVANSLQEAAEKVVGVLTLRPGKRQ
jgi:succinyl-CoA synthetase beta subunit